ncbi:MAG: type restriction enzyme protein [Solirubrobacteraceae bacterium]|jgi:type I restriction enzyme M protein|nr:type restriction enzyme protein [Solirubrobacteraceae bacterium]
MSLADAIDPKGIEHALVRLPTIARLQQLGWSESQMRWAPEWRVPQTPHDAAKREISAGGWNGWPVDLVIFDSEKHAGEWEHVLAIFEFKEPSLEEGQSQLEIYLSREPRAKYGYWTNGSQSLAVYKLPDGNVRVVKGANLPKPQDDISKPSAKPLTYHDLTTPTERELRGVFKRLLDTIAVADSKSVRPDEQLNELCNLLLLKLESDTNASDSPTMPVAFQLASSEAETAKRIRKQFEEMRLLRTDVFTEAQDDELLLDEHTVQQAVYELSSLKLMDMGGDAVSSAFQVFRRANLKAGEGQYFTPRRVIESAVRIMEITRQDKIIDPACGTGGFLIEAYRSVAARGTSPNALANARTFAHKQIWGVDKDGINVKLARAIMVILGDGSANIHVGDSLREHRWKEDYPHLMQPVKDGSYTAVITNPPFGQKLKVSVADARRNKFTISNAAAGGATGDYATLEIGLIFLERAYRLLVAGGKLGIVLPETYFFSPTYRWLPGWLAGRLELRGVLNIPMEAFQGFCRAKTNFYIFEKI